MELIEKWGTERGNCYLFFNDNKYSIAVFYEYSSANIEVYDVFTTGSLINDIVLNRETNFRLPSFIYSALVLPFHPNYDGMKGPAEVPLSIFLRAYIHEKRINKISKIITRCN